MPHSETKYAAGVMPTAQDYEHAALEWFDAMKVDGQPLPARIKRYAAQWITSRARELSAARQPAMDSVEGEK